MTSNQAQQIENEVACDILNNDYWLVWHDTWNEKKNVLKNLQHFGMPTRLSKKDKWLDNHINQSVSVRNSEQPKSIR
jgi:hypothetical protein